MLSKEKQLEELGLFCQRRGNLWVNSQHGKYLRVTHADEELDMFRRPPGTAQNNGGKNGDRVQLQGEPSEDQKCLKTSRTASTREEKAPPGYWGRFLIVFFLSDLLLLREDEAKKLEQLPYLQSQNLKYLMLNS